MTAPSNPLSEVIAASWPGLKPRLEMFFSTRNADDVDQLVGEVGRRLVDAVQAGRDIEHIDRFALGIARNVFLEHVRSEVRGRKVKEFVAINTASAMDQDLSWMEADRDMLAALLRCLDDAPDDRDFILRFHGAEHHVRERAAFALELGITLNALYIRALRVRKSLKRCVEQRMQA